MMVDSAIADIIIRAMQGKQNGTLLPHGIRDEFFESKIKRLLESLVFGMKPNETWNGDLSAFPLIDTGYGFDIYKKGAFIDCLYENTILKMSVLHKSDTESVLSIEIELQN
jgi:hypothetical protein